MEHRVNAYTCRKVHTICYGSYFSRDLKWAVIAMGQFYIGRGTPFGGGLAVRTKTNQNLVPRNKLNIPAMLVRVKLHLALGLQQLLMN